MKRIATALLIAAGLAYSAGTLAQTPADAPPAQNSGAAPAKADAPKKSKDAKKQSKPSKAAKKSKAPAKKTKKASRPAKK